jgi:hypothetical protein
MVLPQYEGRRRPWWRRLIKVVRARRGLPATKKDGARNFSKKSDSERRVALLGGEYGSDE